MSTAIAEHLGIDNAAKLDDPTRPDLVFVLSDTDQPHLISIVELKSPSLPLKYEHLTQLKTYMAKVENYCRTELGRAVTVHGYLIGAMPDEKTVNDDERLLLSEMSKSGPGSEWIVIGVRSLLERAQVAHASVIQSLENDIENDRTEYPDELPSEPGVTAPDEERIIVTAAE